MSRAALVLAATWARRELRWGLAGFRIFLACLILGVASIAAVRSVSQSFSDAIAAESRALLGGDVAVRQIQRPSPDEAIDWLRGWGDVSASAELRAMARTQAGERTVIELKAVDGAYPLFGHVISDTDQPLKDLLAPNAGGLPGAIADPLLMDRLSIAVGDTVRIGEADFQVRGRLLKEPDGGASAFTLGPRVIVSDAGLSNTGLIQPGSQVRYNYKIALADGTDAGLEAFKSAAGASHPTEAWRISDRSDAAPQLRRFVERIAVFLTFVGLTALIVGGVGVGNGVRAYFDRKASTIATLKCLGASANLIFAVYLMEVLVFAGIGVGVGLAFGAAAPFLAAWGLGPIMPVPIVPRVYPFALGEAALYGFLVAVIFTLWPLAKARALPAAALFRDRIAGETVWPGRGFALAVGGGLALLSGTAIAFTPFHTFAAVFIAGAAATFALLIGLGRGIMAGARRMPRPRGVGARLALSNLHRPGAPTPAIVLSLGLGFTLLAGIALLDGNIRHQVGAELPKEIPAFFMIDIQKSQKEAFESLVAAEPGVDGVVLVPNIRGRIVEIAGKPAADVTPDPEVAWVLRGDQGLTYAADIPEGSKVVEGTWWPADYAGPPKLSIYAEAAKGIGLKLGDTLTLNVMGREIAAEVANLREIDWSYPGFNYVIVYAPGVLEAAPHMYVANVKAKADAEAAVYRAVSDAFPNVSIIRTRDALSSITRLLDQLAFGVRATSAIALLAGALVLAGALAAGYRARVYDSVILKVLGATRPKILWSYLLEFAALGLAVGLFAALLGSVISWALMNFMMEAPWVLLPGTLAVTLGLAMALTAGLGLVATVRALGEPPAEVLRTL